MSSDQKINDLALMVEVIAKSLVDLPEEVSVT